MKMATKDALLILSGLAVFAAVIKFLLDGVTMTLYGHPVSFGHVDSMTYATLLTPILGAHGYVGGLEHKGSVSKEE